MRAAVLFVFITVAIGCLALSGPSRAEQEDYDAVDLRLRGLVGEVEIITGGVDRVSVDYEVDDRLIDPPRFDVDGDELEIAQLADRRRWWRDVQCRGGRGGLRVSIEDGGFHPLEDYGRYVIRVPADARVRVEGGVLVGEIGDTRELEVALNSCGDIDAGDVAEDASLAVNGSGDLTLGAVGGALRAAINGSGDVETGEVAGGVDAAINGSGDVRIAAIDGPVHAAINGSGSVNIEGGRADSIDVAISGSGDVRFDGVAGDVNLAAFGSGRLWVAEVEGRISSAPFGAGRVRVGRRD